MPISREQPSSITIRFGGEDAAFTDDWRGESGRILRRLADRIENGELSNGDEKLILDVNGNTIGEVCINR
jgi:hypothetical protein